MLPTLALVRAFICDVALAVHQVAIPSIGVEGVPLAVGVVVARIAAVFVARVPDDFDHLAMTTVFSLALKVTQRRAGALARLAFFATFNAEISAGAFVRLANVNTGQSGIRTVPLRCCGRKGEVGAAGNVLLAECEAVVVGRGQVDADGFAVCPATLNVALLCR